MVIAKLRRRFIGIAMGSMFAVLFLIVAAINGLNYRHLIEDTDRLIEKVYIHCDEDLFSGKPFDSRFYFVRFDQEGVVQKVNTSQIRDVDDEEAIAEATSVLDSTVGFRSHFRYRVYDDEGGKIVIFLNCEHQLDIFQNFFLSSILVSLFGLAAVFILIVIISKLVFKSVIENDMRQKQLITNAGHELKTPLAIIQANADMIELELGENEWTKGIEAQVKRMTDLTNDLMMLARTEEGVTMVMQTFDLSAVYAEMAASFEGLAITNGMQLKYHIEPDIHFYGNQKYLSELLSIFLENALKYASPQAVITLDLYRKSNRLYLSVTNPTEQDLNQDLNHWFDRFYRQSGKSGKSGYGLGLAIAKAITMAHQGEISAHKKGEKTLEMRVILPYRQSK